MSSLLPTLLKLAFVAVHSRSISGSSADRSRSPYRPRSWFPGQWSSTDSAHISTAHEAANSRAQRASSSGCAGTEGFQLSDLDSSIFGVPDWEDIERAAAERRLLRIQEHCAWLESRRLERGYTGRFRAGVLSDPVLVRDCSESPCYTSDISSSTSGWYPGCKERR